MNEDWTKTSLADHVEFAGGYSFPIDAQGENEGDVPFLKVSDMNTAGNEVQICHSTNYVSRERLKVIKARSWPTGTVIFPKVGAALLTEKRRILGVEAAFDNNVMGLRAKSNLIPKFLYYFMCSVRLGDFAQMGAVPSINQSHINAIRLNLPPLATQRRIVAVIDPIDKQIAALDAERDALKRMAYSLISSDSPATPLGSAVVARGGKRMPKGQKFSVFPTAHPYLRVVDMHDLTFDDSALEFVPDDVWPSIRRYTVAPGDLVISIVGSIGKVGIVPDWAAGANLTENAAIVDIDEAVLDRRWLALWLSTVEGQREIKRVTVGTSQGKLALSRIPLIEAPMLNLDEQARLATAGLGALHCADGLTDELLRLQALRSATLNALLSREIEIPESFDELLETKVAV